jgi:hypothetical protein
MKFAAVMLLMGSSAFIVLLILLKAADIVQMALNS